MSTSELKSAHPLTVLDLTIGTAHINALGHLEAGAYVTLFEKTIAPLFSRLGITDDRLLHTDTSGAILSPFLVEMHVCYIAELNTDDAVTISAQLLDIDTKRAHLILSMTKAPKDHQKGLQAATCELLVLNMDTSARKPANWSTTQGAAWHKLRDQQSRLPPPPQVGRAIAPLTSQQIPRPSGSNQ
jgi:acyl-CoA thioester hydrolase